MNFCGIPLIDLNSGASFPFMDCHIRLVQPGDEWPISEFYLQNRDYLQPWEPVRNEAFYTIEYWCNRIACALDLHEKKEAFSFVILDESEQNVIGMINYTSVSSYPFHACHLGYALAQSQQGKGIMHTALTLTNQWMFKQVNLHRIMAAYIPRNRASEKVLTKLNFEHEGTARDYLLINGQWETHHLMSLINPDWINKG